MTSKRTWVLTVEDPEEMTELSCPTCGTNFEVDSDIMSGDPFVKCGSSPVCSARVYIWPNTYRVEVEYDDG